MTTATKRLRRASIAGLATIATVGGALGVAGTAFAFQTATSTVNVTLTSGGNATASVGGSGQTLSDLTLKFPANSGAEEYLAGEQIEFVLDSDGADPVNSGSNTLNTASFAAAPTVTANNGVASPAATVALASVDGTNDAFTLTFNADAPENANATNFTISGLKVNLGSKVAAGQNLLIDAGTTAGVNPNIFWVGGAASDTTSVQVASLPLVAVTASKVAVAAPGDDANLGTITIKDVTGGNLQAGDDITLTLNNGTWITAPKATGSPALTGNPTINSGDATELDLTVGSTAAAAGNTITLTGGVVNATAGGAVTVDFADATNTIALSPTGVQLAVGVDQNRIGGADRFATAGLLFSGTATSNAGLGFTGFTSTSVVLTSGTNFPDALSAQYLAAELSTGGNNVGILTTDPNSLSTAAQQQILHSNTGTINTVYIVGGTAAVSQNVANQVAALHVGNVPTAANVSVVRIGGADRYQTNNLVDLYLGAAGNTTAFIATGAKFADALSIGPAVYATGSPLILTDSATLVDSAKSTLQNLGITHVVIVGGTSAISDAVATAITNLGGITIDTRLSGADRTMTSAAVEAYETDASFNGSNPFQIDNVYIARGDNFADALVAGPVAALSDAGAGQGNPILLTGDPNTLGGGIPSVFSGNAANVSSVSALGLTSAISVATLSAAAGSLS